MLLREASIDSSLRATEPPSFYPSPWLSLAISDISAYEYIPASNIGAFQGIPVSKIQ